MAIICVLVIVLEITIGEPLSSLIVELARSAGKDVDVYLMEVLSQNMDPEKKIKMYLALCVKFMGEARRLEGEGDFVQASEKYWGAITALLNIIGEKKNMPHFTHRDYWEIMNQIIDDTRDEALTELFALAEKLHANFSHNFIPEHQFSIYSKKVKYIQKLGVKVPEK